MSYTEVLTLRVPVTLETVAANIGRALDPDVGGDKSFTLDIESNELVCTTPCTPSFKEQVNLMLEHPNMLYAVVKQDYDNRWPDMVPPTLEECTQFLSAVVVS